MSYVEFHQLDKDTLSKIKLNFDSIAPDFDSRRGLCILARLITDNITGHWHSDNQLALTIRRYLRCNINLDGFSDINLTDFYERPWYYRNLKMEQLRVELNELTRAT